MDALMKRPAIRDAATDRRSAATSAAATAAPSAAAPSAAETAAAATAAAATASATAASAAASAAARRTRDCAPQWRSKVIMDVLRRRAAMRAAARCSGAS